MEDKKTEIIEEKDNKHEDIVSTLLVLLGLTVLIILIMFFQKRNNTEEITSINSEDRFEIIYEQDIPSEQLEIRILVDRDTDVEYLLIYDKVSHNTSITLMRDKGGMVLLRE